MRPADRPVCRTDGRAATLEAGIERAATILTQARSPLVFGLPGATCEAQRVAVALADRLGGFIDPGSATGASLSAATQHIGMVTATLGEVRHRADLIIFWCVDPATTHPRHFERYSLTCAGEFVPRGRVDRTCVVVDSQRTATADAADLFLELEPDGEMAALDALRRIAAAEDNGEQPGDGSSRELIDRMKSARYGAVFFQPGPSTECLLLLVRELNRHTRVVALPLGEPGNAAGAEQVLTWQTGHSAPVCFAGGAPVSDGETYSAAALLAAGTVDAALVVACDPLTDPIAAMPEAARGRLAAIPTIVLQTADCEPIIQAAVAFTVATPGIDVPGSVFRADGVALPLRPPVASAYPGAETILHSIEQHVR